MDKFSDLIAAVQSDLNVNDTSTLFSVPTIKQTLNRARLKAEGMFRWPALQDSKKTSSKAGYEYYDAPNTWRPHSIWKLKVDGVRYGEEPDGSPLTFPDYLLFKEDYPSSTEKKWALQWLRYFISPIPTSNGNNNIEIWGQKNGLWLTGDDDTTIFSYSIPECNQAIVLETVKLLKMKGEDARETIIPRVGDLRDLDAKEILTTAWNKIKQEETKKEKSKPMLNVPNFFNRGRNRFRSSPKGDFDL